MKIAVDAGMTAILLLLMAYGMVGEEAHEWLGIGMFGLFVVHHVLNRKWSGSIFKGKYTLFRGIVALIAGYGVYAFWRRDIWNYMILRNHFAFFDFEELIAFFLMDYAAVVILFAEGGHYISKALKSRTLYNKSLHRCQKSSETVKEPDA